ncbi:MAG TPA: hypothetical protein VHF22_10585, partial [Planctomycetota bacterium]|nr:hypothetical protein [Planctomycetota bacterium]
IEFGAPRPSKGSGGLTGRVSGAFTDSRGRSGKFALEAPADMGPDKSYGVLFYFHADGDDANYASYVSRLKTTAAKHGLMVVSMQEPDEGAWWAPRSADDAAYVKEFLEAKLLAKYNVDRSRVFFSGESGGASFAAGLPARLGFEYGGGVVLASDGDVPRENGGNPDDDESAAPPMRAHPAVPARAKRDFGAYFAVGSEDPELRNALASAAYYRSLGMSAVRLDVVPGAGHADFSAVRAIGEGLDALDPR